MENTKRWWYSIFLFLLLIATICILKLSECSRRNIEKKLLTEHQQSALRNLRKEKDTNFDILIFTQHWPYTVCSEWMEEHKNNECTLPKQKNSWTIHGIWPTKYHIIGPVFCNDSWAFDMNKIAPIEDELTEKWINIEKNTPLDGLWKHEWEKHGTCAATQLKSVDSELKYFQQGLDFLDRYSISTLLKGTYIQPGIDRSYKLEEIHETLAGFIDNNFAIVCKTDRKNKRQYLFEIRICFDKDLNLHSCDGIVMADLYEQDPSPSDKIITNCKKDTEIVYPSQAWLMQKRWAKQLEERRYKDSWVKHVVNSYKLVRLLQWATI